MKQRFSSLDVKIIAHELSSRLVSLRLGNIYDLSSRIFLLKFAKPNHREQLVIDSGFRCHLTDFDRATAAAPSAFVAKLRKYIKTRRVTAVTQVGTDRVIEIRFSESTYRLFLEFYAGGNIILTDAELNILTLWRIVNEGAEHEQYRPGVKYDLSQRQNYAGVPELTPDRIRRGLENAVQKQESDAQQPGKKFKRKPGDSLRRALAVTTHEFPPVLLDHALEVSSFDRTISPEAVLQDQSVLDKLMLALQEAAKVIADITSADHAKGYILAKRKQKEADPAQPTTRQDLLYDDFHPFKPAQLVKDPSLVVLEYDGFNKSVDDFFSSIEGQKLESKLQEREDTARRKIEQARGEQAKRIDGLQQLQEVNILKAQALEANVERVEEAAAAVNGLIAQGMDWVDIGRLIENEQGRHNAVAQLIKLPLKLEENTITLLLSGVDEEPEADFADVTDSEASDSDDDDDQTTSAARSTQPADTRLAIDIDLALSPWANARQYYENRRAAAVKQDKTAQASERALKSTEQKVMADLKKGLKQEKEVLRPVRKQRWFEKFIYFISSDGYLVLAGKDAQQNEMLYRRYLKKGDVYLHADLHGAASVIIKNIPATPDAPIPPSTLSQAGSLAVCTSSAWDSKAVMSAWWVNSDQVSKTAPTGEYITTGGFVIKGKKNFLPPAQLLLGFAVVFQISEDSKARHVKHRLRSDENNVTATDTAPKETHSSALDVDEDEDDDEFPDAAAGNGDDDDDDDDFPDAQTAHAETTPGSTGSTGSPEDVDPDAEKDEERAARSNPLQTAGANGNDRDESLNEDEDDDEQDERDGTVNSASDRAVSDTTTDEGRNKPQTSQDTAKATPKQQPRGKRGKAKKIASKYADQDEEERKLAMKLLGSNLADERRQAEAEIKSAHTETAEEARARRKAQHEKTQKQGLEAEDVRRLNLEEGIEELNEDEAAAMTQLDALVGTPLPGDEILEAIPICAPWSALTKYKYKVKLQPGQQKKGKAVREILGKWTSAAGNAKALDHTSQDTEKIWPREAELIKAWREPEVLGVIPVKQVRVVMSGGASGGSSGGQGKGGKGGKSGRGGRGSKKVR